MRYMQELIARMVDVPLARMFVLAAILFLLLAVLGRIEGKIEPGRAGRIGATLLGVLLMFLGLTMHFNETDALRDKVRESMGQTQSVPAQLSALSSGNPAATLAMAAPSGAGDKPESSKSAIKIVSGTYGKNCGAKAGNVTDRVARACDGQGLCEYKIDPAALENSAPDCARDFIAEWKCGVNEVIYTVSMPAGAMRNEPPRLACLAK